MNTNTSNQNQNDYSENIQRRFKINDDWLNVKIYCGPRTQDLILVKIIDPLIDYLIREKHIEKWFFLRSQDPYDHIGLRIKGFSKKDNLEILSLLMNEFNQYIEDDRIWKVQLDEYQRELERYGTIVINLAEDFFFYDSNMMLYLLSHCNNDEELFVFTLKYIDFVLNMFKLSNPEKLVIVKENDRLFKCELTNKVETNRSLSLKYRKSREKIESILTRSDLNISFRKTNFTQFEKITHSIILLSKNNNLEVKIDNLLSSFIRTSVNRIFRSKQRKYEMVIYDFLTRFYRSEINRTT